MQGGLRRNTGHKPGEKMWHVRGSGEYSESRPFAIAPTGGGPVKHGIRLGVSALAAVLLAACPAPAADKEAVNKAIENGLKYLKSQQREDGAWASDQGGMTALAGLTLLECGVPADDAHVQKAAEAVRN